MHPTATSAMADDKGKMATCCDAQFQYDESARASNERGQVKTKHVFVAVTCVVVVIVLVGGLLGAAYVFKAAANDIVKFHVKANDKDGQSINEDVESDTTDDVVTYHMMTSMGEQWVVNDFSKRITLNKISTNGNTACFVSPLNESEADPQTVRANMRETNIKSSESSFFRVTDGAITRPQFLGKKINTMCDSASIYWLTPTCVGNGTDVERPASEDDVSSRHKRAALQCVVCGCYKVYAPRVTCVRRVFGRKAYYYIYYRGRPLIAFRVVPACNGFRKC
ncbi:hypothetical protein NP493_288g03008 [Ridgeia piscesae]|uniref:BRICHOS domain-containing protein n=1 Tax=Ridgeia piscesae TaxID=27915 RepID=A0AAD9NWX1_RIDPI|nr:hypothetical protein NP493_288g03008 [Ridgeia piscesae]